LAVVGLVQRKVGVVLEGGDDAEDHLVGDDVLDDG
jgi:hypothetical protein